MSDRPQIPALSKPTSPTGAYMGPDWIQFFNKLVSFTTSIAAGEVLDADPDDPANGTWWIVAEAASPLTTISLKVQLYDATWILASIDVPTP